MGGKEEKLKRKAIRQQSKAILASEYGKVLYKLKSQRNVAIAIAIGMVVVAAAEWIIMLLIKQGVIRWNG